MDPAPLHIVSGKGGTGKTTVALALAARLAMAGGKVLVCEVEGRHGLAEVCGVPRFSGATERRLFAAGAGEVYGLEVEPEDALSEYLDKFAGLAVAGWALDRSGLTAFATSIAPGLRDILLIGKVYEAARRNAKGLPSAYAAVVLDAPPTGRIVSFLGAGDALADVARGGPVHRQARSIMEVLRNHTTQVHLTTLLRELPVTETVSAMADIAALRIPLGTVFCNQVAAAVPPPPATLDLDLPSVQIAGLLDLLHSAAHRAAREAEWRAVIAAHAERVVELPRVVGAIGTAGLLQLAKEIVL